MIEKLTILLVDDNRDFLESASRILKRSFNVAVASDVASAQDRAALGVAAVVLDVRLDDKRREDRQGLQLLSWLRQQHPNTPVIMMTAVDDLEVAVEAMKLGASDFIVKSGIRTEELRKAIDQAIRNSRLARKVANLEQRLEEFEPSDLIGESSALTEIKKLIDMFAQDGECSVLILGDTGTGKELVARAIHRKGRRRNGPFIGFSIASQSKDLIATLLFGHEKGAFTGATERRIGYIEAADDGILFLDEIGDTPPDVQVALLRVLETREVVRVGSTKPVTVDFQLLAATHQDLQHAVATGAFRKDLYYRLKNTLIYIPPLAQRILDIPILANHFLQLLRQAGRTTATSISPEAMNCLNAYHWPGNVRELKNCIDTAALKAKYGGVDVILPTHLLAEVTSQEHRVGAASDNGPQLQGLDVDKALARAELSYISQALRITGGKVAEASKLLRYPDRFTLRRRVEQNLRRYPELEMEFNELKAKYAR